MSVFQWWLLEDQSLTAEQVATHLHHLVRATVREALGS
jgi:hypothetical protein